MKSVAVLALASGAAAQVSLYLSIATAIDGSIGKLDSAIKAYTGGDGSAVIASASALLTVVNSASAAGAKGQNVSQLGDALSLLTPFVNVVNSVSTVIGDLVSKKTLAFQNGLGSTAEDILKQESTAAGGLAALITQKLVGDAVGAKPIAQSSIIAPLNNALNSGISAFSSGPAATGGSGSSSSKSSSSSGSSSSSSSSSTMTTTSTSGSGSTTTTSSTSSSAPMFTGNSASGLELGGGLAFIVGALAYVL